LTYNKALEYIKNNHEHKKSFYWLRNRFVNADNISQDLNFLLQCPKHVREGAIKDLSQAFATNFSKKRKDSGHNFGIRFRKKKDNHSIVIPKDAFKLKEDGVRLYPSMLTSDVLLPSHLLPSADCRLSTDRLGRFILYVPVEQQTFTLSDNQARRMCSIDPGVRTFLTTWSPTGEAYKLGEGDAVRLHTLLLRMDKLQSLIAKSNGRMKWRREVALLRLRQRFENIQTDMHYQCAKFLTDRYSLILIPAFGSKRMSSKVDRKLRKKTVRSMLNLGHYKFRQRLKEVAEKRGIVVVECDEAYTTKTCSCCGSIHPNLGGRKEFVCKECGLRIDRDLQGAFNIFLKYASTHPEIVLWM
jgi:putative transposase